MPSNKEVYTLPLGESSSNRAAYSANPDAGEVEQRQSPDKRALNNSFKRIIEKLDLSPHYLGSVLDTARGLAQEHPDEYVVQRNLATILQKNGISDEATMILNRLHSDFEEDTVSLSHGIKLFGRGDSETKLETKRLIANVYTTSHEEQRKYGLALDENGMEISAFLVFKNIYSRFDINETTKRDLVTAKLKLYNRGERLLDINETCDAHEIFQILEIEDPYSIPIHEKLYITYTRLGYLQMAYHHLNMANQIRNWQVQGVQQ